MDDTDLSLSIMFCLIILIILGVIAYFNKDKLMQENAINIINNLKTPVSVDIIYSTRPFSDTIKFYNEFKKKKNKSSKGMNKDKELEFVYNYINPVTVYTNIRIKKNKQFKIELKKENVKVIVLIIKSLNTNCNSYFIVIPNVINKYNEILIDKNIMINSNKAKNTLTNNNIEKYYLQKKNRSIINYKKISLDCSKTEPKYIKTIGKLKEDEKKAMIIYGFMDIISGFTELSKLGVII